MRSALGQMLLNLLYQTILSHQNLKTHPQMICSSGAAVTRSS